MIHVYCVIGSSFLQAVLIVKLVILMMVNMKIVVCGVWFGAMQFCGEILIIFCGYCSHVLLVGNSLTYIWCMQAGGQCLL